MKFQERLYEKNKIVRLGVRFQNSVLYPVFFAILCCISGLNGKEIYVPIFWIFCVCIAFSVCFSADNKVLLVPMLMIYYALGRDKKQLYVADRGELLQSFDLDGIKNVIICGCVMVAMVIIRFIADGTFKRAIKKRGICFWGVVALDVVFLLNGAFSSRWTPENLIYGALMALGFTVFYCVVLSMLDGSQNTISYACKTMVCTAYLVLVQLLFVTLKLYLEDSLFAYKHGTIEILYLRRGDFTFSWGVATIIGAVIVLGIPAAMYLARNRRFSLFSYMSAILFLSGIIIIDTRSAIIVGVFAFIVGAICCCTGGKNKAANRVYSIIFLVFAIGGLLFLIKKGYISEVLRLLRFSSVTESGRFNFWKNAALDFSAYPIFGVGLRDGGVESANLFSGMYHNLVLQFLASMGIVGMVAFLVHIKNLAEILLRRFCASKLLLLMIPISVLLMSLVDNFFFYLNFQIFYAVFLVLAELYLEKDRKRRLDSHVKVEEGRKPRVVFSFVEAGKGHIVPERAVCDSFKRKYAEHAEIVESCFYSETNNEKLKKTERLFESAVRIQNKNRVLSLLCRTGNFLTGDTFGLYFLMRCTFSGMRSKKLAQRHMEELDADLMFTTHWSTAFYASRMERPPYVVLLCPDAYSNGMFNVDVNDFLMVTESGKRAAEHRRMYAGGSISVVGFPIRTEAKEYYGRKSEQRAELGIGESDFVVTLSDGGYGIARLERTVDELTRGGVPLTIIALCGTNVELYERLSRVEAPEKIKIIPVPFTNDVLRYVAVADIFCGKSGANSVAEAAYFGVPMVINGCITYIERKIKNYYVRELGSALYIPSSKLAARKIIEFARSPQELEGYRNSLTGVAGKLGSDDIADILFDRVSSKK